MVRNIIQKEEIEIKCDYCGIKQEFDVVNIDFGYGSQFDSDSLNFCSDECCKKWLIKNTKN